MKLKITNSCIACGICEETCPQVFTVQDKSKINKKQVLQENINSIKLAIKMCPRKAILEVEQ